MSSFFKNMFRDDNEITPLNAFGSKAIEVICDESLILERLESIKQDGVYRGFFFDSFNTLHDGEKPREEIVKQFKEMHEAGIPVFIMTLGAGSATFFDEAKTYIDKVYIIDKHFLRGKDLMVVVDDCYAGFDFSSPYNAQEYVNSVTEGACVEQLKKLADDYIGEKLNFEKRSVLAIDKCVSFDRVGAKAQNLADLSRWGNNQNNVPEGFVLSQHFFNDVYKDVLPEIDEIVSNISADMDETKNAADCICKIIDGVDIPASVAEMLSGHKKWAVRSSGDYEDGENSSFAGVYESILDVGNTDTEVVEAVTNVVKSFYSFGALDYYINATKNEKYPNPIRPAVIIQKQVDAKYSGVIFSSSPTMGDDFIHINITKGLGDELMNGTKKGYDIFINKITKEKIGNKKIIKDLNFMEIEDVLYNVMSFCDVKSLNSHQNIDMEFAIDKDDKINVLQVRPVTVSKNDIKISQCGGMTILNSQCEGFVCGCLQRVEKDSDAINIGKDDIALVSEIKISQLPYLKRAAAVVVESSHQAALSHASILLREVVARNKIAAFIGKNIASRDIKTGEKISVDLVTGKIICDNRYHR